MGDALVPRVFPLVLSFTVCFVNGRTCIHSLPSAGEGSVSSSSSSGGGHRYDFLSRFFAPWMGIPEDHVTGSAHAVLGPYWQARLPSGPPEAYEAAVLGPNWQQARLAPGPPLVGNGPSSTAAPKTTMNPIYCQAGLPLPPPGPQEGPSAYSVDPMSSSIATPRTSMDQISEGGSEGSGSSGSKASPTVAGTSSTAMETPSPPQQGPEPAARNASAAIYIALASPAGSRGAAAPSGSGRATSEAAPAAAAAAARGGTTPPGIRRTMVARQCSPRGGDLTVRVEAGSGRVVVGGQAVVVIRGTLHL